MGYRILSRAFVLLFIAAVSSAGAFAQSRPSPTPPTTQQPSDDRHDPDVDFAARETDVRTRLIIKAEKKAYEEHVERAKEAKQIAAELKAVYDAKQALNSADQKKLERLEKLTRRIRNEVGGSDDDADPKDLPKSIGEAIESMAKMTEELCDQVEKTPRHVISATIIDQANKLISVIQFVRDSRH